MHTQYHSYNIRNNSGRHLHSRNSHPVNHKRLIRIYANIVGIGTVILALFSVLGAPVLIWMLPFIRSFLPLVQDEFFGYALSLAAYCVFLGIPCVILMSLLKAPSPVAFPLHRPKPDILVCAVLISLGMRIVGSMVTGYFSAVFEGFTGLTPEAPASMPPQSTAAYFIYFLSVAVAPAILEEAMFRGVIMQSLRRFGDSFAVVASSVLFALAHGNLVQGPYSFTLGLLIGYFVVITGSLWAGIAIHFVNNFIALVLERMMSTLSPDIFNAFAGAFFIFSILLGLAGIAFMRMRYGRVFYLTRGNYPVREGQKHRIFFTSPFILATIILSLREAWRYLA